MNILAVDTSSKTASCAFASGSRLIGEIYADTGLTHSQTIMPMVDSLLSMTGAELRDVDAFAVSVGPGSFTGLRIGIAAVKGMAMPSGQLCAPVSTLHGLALNAPFFSGSPAAGDGISINAVGYIIPVLDARREQVYTAIFTCGDDGVRRVSADEAVSLDDLGRRLSAIPGPKMLVGDGAYLAAERLKYIGGLRVAPPGLVYQRASSLCAAAAEIALAGGLVTSHALAPSYLRLPQAERELKSRMEKPAP